MTYPPKSCYNRSDMAQDRSPIERPKPQAATRLGTGGTVLAGVDMRTAGGRRFKELCADLVQHLANDVTAQQLAIIRRAAALAVWCEGQEAAQASGGDFDVQAFTTAANTLRRLLSDLGLERRMRDATPTLSQYLADRAAS